MDRAFRNGSFVLGVVLSMVGSGVAVNFFMRAKPIDAQLIILLIVGVVLLCSGWRQSQKG